MNNLQNNRLMDWVSVMLSGSWTHTKKALIIPNTQLRSAFGVALGLLGHGTDVDGFFLDDYPAVIKTQSVSNVWLSQRFGLTRPASFYATMNDLKNDYFTVAASLLGECLQCDEKIRLQQKLIDSFNYTRMRS